MRESILRPDWPAPAGVRAAFTLRTGGVSLAPYDSLNVGRHVEDDPAAVSVNRRRIAEYLELPDGPWWLEQVHGNEVSDLDAGTPMACADAAVTASIGRVCVVQVADCLPVLLAAMDGTAVGAVHCGWRGLAGGVLEAAIARMRAEACELYAWLGPAIGPGAFEVGEEVRAAFVAHDACAESAFTANSRGRFQCDLFLLARQRLAALGVERIFGGGICTYSDPTRFFSFRRDGRCGRMAALVWLAGAA